MELKNNQPITGASNGEQEMFDIDTYRTNLCVMKNEREEGFDEGFEEGRKEKAFEAARLMLQDGLAIEKIICYTGLTREEIESIHDLSAEDYEANN